MDGAAEALQQAIAIDPGSSFLRLALAEIYLKNDEVEKAIRSAEDALIQDPASVEANLFLGSIHFGRGEDEQSRVGGQLLEAPRVVLFDLARPRRLATWARILDHELALAPALVDLCERRAERAERSERPNRTFRTPERSI